MAHILYDGLNLQLEQGTGVATYARTLVQAARGLGHEASVLYALPEPVPTDPLLREIALFDRKPRQKGPAAEVRRFLRWRGGRAETVEIPLSGTVLLDPIRERVPPVDGFVAAWDVFVRAARYFARTGRLLEIGCERQPDIAHFTYPLPMRVAGAANLYTIHDLVSLRMPYAAEMRRGFMLALMRRLVREADRIVTVSEAARADIVSILGADPARVVNTAQTTDLPEGLGERPATAPFGLRLGGYLLFNGALEPKKNVGRLLEACLVADLPLPLILVGGPGWHHERERATIDDPRHVIHHGPQAGQRRFRHLGYVARETLRELMRGARALTFPSLHEGFGLPALEAMALGTPVLASTDAALGEIVGPAHEGAALLVDPLDVGSIAAGLVRLVEDDALCRELARRGLERAAMFSRARYAERVGALYRKVLTGDG